MGLRSHRCKEKLVITRGDEQKIIAALPARRAKPGEAGPRPWMEEAFLVGMRQGCRLMEIRCPMASVDTERMVITFQIKGGRLHAAPLHPDLLGLVEKARAEKREFLVNVPSDASKQWATFIRKIGFDYTFHCTRVTVVTRLCEAGFSESQTMAYVGHSSHLVHALYRKMRPVSVAALGDALR
jgi:integrase